MGGRWGRRIDKWKEIGRNFYGMRRVGKGRNLCQGFFGLEGRGDRDEEGK